MDHQQFFFVLLLSMRWIHEIWEILLAVSGKLYTSTFCTSKFKPQLMLAEVRPDDPYYRSLVNGIVFLKFGRKASPHSKLIKLSEDYRYLTWKSKAMFLYERVCRGKMLSCFMLSFCLWISVDLQRATKVVRGVTSQRFLGYLRNQRIFTIFYNDEHGKEMTLELMAPSPEAFEEAYYGLSALVEINRHQSYVFSCIHTVQIWVLIVYCNLSDGPYGSKFIDLSKTCVQ